MESSADLLRNLISRPWWRSNGFHTANPLHLLQNIPKCHTWERPIKAGLLVYTLKLQSANFPRICLEILAWILVGSDDVDLLWQCPINSGFSVTCWKMLYLPTPLYPTPLYPNAPHPPAIFLALFFWFWENDVPGFFRHIIYDIWHMLSEVDQNMSNLINI
jgi:hypothetical protein